MDNFLHNTSNVAVALGIVKGTELSRSFVVVSVRFELATSIPDYMTN